MPRDYGYNLREAYIAQLRADNEILRRALRATFHARISPDPPKPAAKKPWAQWLRETNKLLAEQRKRHG